MRQIYSLNPKWAFSKEATAVPTQVSSRWNFVNLPHSWNAIDGQDGNADYFRGTAYYAKNLDKLDLPKADRYYVEVNGASSSASLYWNGKKMATHHGGYSTWRVDVTEEMAANNLVVFEVDNSPNDSVYPQNADFTFYGGLYRDINLICVSESHFDLEYYGGPGIKVTPIVDGDNANVEVEVFVKGMKDGQYFQYTIVDAEGNAVANAVSTECKFSCTLENVHKWHGRKDPYLYTAEVNLVEGKEILDNVSARFGCRSFIIDPDRGFILNGEEYPLRGVSRHQDRWGYGNALLPEHHEEDIDLICEVGATTIRLAHYQHAQYFYDLCDEKGLVLWAEIPYITTHMDNGTKNTRTQMMELIVQNYNHPSIVVWGLSNEINAGTEADAGIVPNHHMLNDLCHQMDPTRLTTMAAVSTAPVHHEYISIPDTVSYNHYFGWYGGDLEDYGPWFDKFHAEHPNQPIGCSEYGCEALNWHNSKPDAGDYSEEYQAVYHESLIRQLFSRKYLWATHVWNMFDFGADGRNEGGENGQNHKGLVTFDRKYKKDSFYAYKAWLNPEPMVHLCGKRYIDRVEDVTKVTVYSNQPTVELFANGKSLGVQKHNGLPFFYFDVPNVGETTLVAVAGELKDTSVIRKVETPNESYRLREKSAILNWFDITEPEGYLSLNSKMSDIMATMRGKLLLGGMFLKIKGALGGNENRAMGFEMTDGLMQMMGGFTLLRLTGMMGMMNVNFTKEELLDLNEKLNKIKAKD